MQIVPKPDVRFHHTSDLIFTAGQDYVLPFMIHTCVPLIVFACQTISDAVSCHITMFSSQIPSVRNLLGLCGPLYVPWLISFAVIYPINRVSFWPRPKHIITVFQKGARVLPFSTQGDTPATIMFIRLVIGILTPRLYRTMCRVQVMF